MYLAVSVIGHLVVDAAHKNKNWIIIIMFSYYRSSFPWYFFSWANGEPQHSGFKSQIVALSLWSAMFLVRLFYVENLLNVVLVLFPLLLLLLLFR
jgi:hypothetical protein